MPGQVVVRGPGNGTVGYCALQSSAATATSPSLTLRATTRAASLVPVEVVFNPGSSSITTDSGLVVPAGDYDVTFTPVGGTAKTLLGALPVVPSGLYPSSWVNANGIPKQLAFGWVGSTGSVTDFHEIDNAVVSSFNAVPQLAVSQTSYAASTLAVGSPVTYTVAASSSGATENQPVTVTQTLPSGVVPVGASGTGWTCAAPVGQTISCTSTSTPFTSGTITVNAVVTSSSVTQSQVQSATSAVASSSDASPATSSSAPAGTVPSAPTVTAITPTNGAAGGANDVKITGTGLNAATAIEIGTAAQFSAGTPTTVVLCASSAPGCFTVVSSTSLDISSMPAHAAGAVTVKVVTLGTSASTSYTYNTGPALLFAAPPSGEANVAYSNQLTVTGGTSPFTWSVSSGSLPPGLTLNASTGLLSGTPTTAGTYTFTVKVTDASGLSDTKPVTLTIIPGPSMTFAPPPGGWTNTVYGYTLTETGGTSPLHLVGEQRQPASRHQPQPRREPERHPDGDRHATLHRQGDRRQRPDRHPGHEHHHRRRGIDHLRGPADGGRQHGVQLHLRRHRRHHPVHLVGQLRDPAGRPDPFLRGRPVRHPHHHRQLPPSRST